MESKPLELKHKTTNAVAWNGVTSVLQQGLSFLTLLVMTRLLSPREFGLVGLATVVIMFSTQILNEGLRLSVIREKDITEEQISGVYWLNLLVSLVMAGVIVALSPLVAAFFKEPVVAPILAALTILFPLEALAMVQGSQLEKTLDFKKIAYINITAAVFGSAAGIAAAFMGFGVWALVINQLALTFVQTSLLLVFIRWIPMRTLPMRKIKKFISFSVYAQLSSFLNFLSRNVDDILVGKVLGSGLLGIYQLSYRLMLWPLQKVIRLIDKVMLPALSLIQDDIKRVKSVYLRVLGTVALIVFPMVTGAFAVCAHAIPHILGEKWNGVVPVFQVLCVLGIMQSVSASQGWVFLSQGRTDVQLKTRIVSVPIIIVSFVMGIHYGVMGVAVAYLLVCIVLIPYQLHMAGKLIDVSLLDIGKSIAAVLVCSLIMAAAVMGIGAVIPSDWPYWLALAIQITAGAAIYLAQVTGFKLNAYIETKELILERIKRNNTHKTTKPNNTGPVTNEQ